MNCPSCQSVNTENAKFCGKCGTKLSESNTVASTSSVEQEQVNMVREEQSTATREVPTMQREQNVQVEKAKELAGNYFSFCKEAAVSPQRFLQNKALQINNGIISLVLISFLFSALFYRLMSNLRSSVNEFSYGMTRDLGPSPMGLSFKFFLMLLILFAIIGGIIFLGGKLMKTDRTFLETLAIWGTIATPVVVMLAIAFVLSFLTAILTTIFLFVGMLAISMSFTLALIRLYRGGLDPLYTVLLANTAVVIAYTIVLASYMESIIKSLNVF
jgi:Double zinc ribbon